MPLEPTGMNFAANREHPAPAAHAQAVRRDGDEGSSVRAGSAVHRSGIIRTWHYRTASIVRSY